MSVTSSEDNVLLKTNESNVSANIINRVQSINSSTNCAAEIFHKNIKLLQFHSEDEIRVVTAVKITENGTVNNSFDDDIVKKGENSMKKWKSDARGTFVLENVSHKVESNSGSNSILEHSADEHKSKAVTKSILKNDLKNSINEDAKLNGFQKLIDPIKDTVLQEKPELKSTIINFKNEVITGKEILERHSKESSIVQRRSSDVTPERKLTEIHKRRESNGKLCKDIPNKDISEKKLDNKSEKEQKSAPVAPTDRSLPVTEAVKKSLNSSIFTCVSFKRSDATMSTAPPSQDFIKKDSSCSKNVLVETGWMRDRETERQMALMQLAQIDEEKKKKRERRLNAVSDYRKTNKQSKSETLPHKCAIRSGNRKISKLAKNEPLPKKSLAQLNHLKFSIQSTREPLPDECPVKLRHRHDSSQTKGELLPDKCSIQTSHSQISNNFKVDQSLDESAVQLKCETVLDNCSAQTKYEFSSNKSPNETPLIICPPVLPQELSQSKYPLKSEPNPASDICLVYCKNDTSPNKCLIENKNKPSPDPVLNQCNSEYASNKITSNPIVLNAIDDYIKSYASVREGRFTIPTKKTKLVSNRARNPHFASIKLTKLNSSNRKPVLLPKNKKLTPDATSNVVATTETPSKVAPALPMSVINGGKRKPGRPKKILDKKMRGRPKENQVERVHREIRERPRANRVNSEGKLRKNSSEHAEIHGGPVNCAPRRGRPKREPEVQRRRVGRGRPRKITRVHSDNRCRQVNCVARRGRPAEKPMKRKRGRPPKHSSGSSKEPKLVLNDIDKYIKLYARRRRLAEAKEIAAAQIKSHRNCEQKNISSSVPLVKFQNSEQNMSSVATSIKCQQTSKQNISSVAAQVKSHDCKEKNIASTAVKLQQNDPQNIPSAAAQLKFRQNGAKSVSTTTTQIKLGQNGAQDTLSTYVNISENSDRATPKSNSSLKDKPSDSRGKRGRPRLNPIIGPKKARLEKYVSPMKLKPVVAAAASSALKLKLKQAKIKLKSKLVEMKKKYESSHESSSPRKTMNSAASIPAPLPLPAIQNTETVKKSKLHCAKTALTSATSSKDSSLSSMPKNDQTGSTQNVCKNSSKNSFSLSGSSFQRDEKDTEAKTDKPESKKKVMREINKLLADEGTINLIYSLGRKRSSAEEEKNSAKHPCSVRRKRKELLLKSKVVKDAVFRMSVAYCHVPPESTQAIPDRVADDGPPSLQREDNGNVSETPIVERTPPPPLLTIEPIGGITQNQWQKEYANIQEPKKIIISSSSVSDESLEPDSSDVSKIPKKRVDLKPHKKSDSVRNSKRLLDTSSNVPNTTEVPESYEKWLPQTIEIRKHGSLVQIVILSPSTFAPTFMSLQVLRELVIVLNKLQTAENCRIVLITSLGNSFCNGIDLQSLICADAVERTKIVNKYVDALTTFTKCLSRIEKVLVAGVHGPVTGFGVAMLPHFDIIYASDTSTFYTPYAKLGYIPEAGSTLTFPHLLGNAITGELLFNCKKLTAYEALQHGLITRTLPNTEFYTALLPLVKAIASHSAQSINMTKKLLCESMNSRLLEQLDEEAKILSRHWSSEECQTRIKQYLQEDNVHGLDS